MGIGIGVKKNILISELCNLKNITFREARQEFLERHATDYKNLQSQKGHVFTYDK